MQKGFIKILIIIAVIAIIGGAGYLILNKGAEVSEERFDEESGSINEIKEPFAVGETIYPKKEMATKICKYEGTKAECNILNVFFYSRDTKSDNPKREDYIYLDEVLKIIKENGGHIIGQSPMTRRLIVEIKPKEKLIELKRILEQSRHVPQVSFNLSAEIKPL